MSEKKKVTIVGDPNNGPRIFFGEDELPYPVWEVKVGQEFDYPFVVLKIGTTGWELKKS